MMLILVLLFCAACKFWTMNKVNYVFVFEFDTRHHLDWRQLFEVSSCWYLHVAQTYKLIAAMLFLLSDVFYYVAQFLAIRSFDNVHLLSYPSDRCHRNCTILSRPDTLLPNESMVSLRNGKLIDIDCCRAFANVIESIVYCLPASSRSSFAISSLVICYVVRHMQWEYVLSLFTSLTCTDLVFLEYRGILLPLRPALVRSTSMQLISLSSPRFLLYITRHLALHAMYSPLYRYAERLPTFGQLWQIRRNYLILHESIPIPD